MTKKVPKTSVNPMAPPLSERRFVKMFINFDLHEIINSRKLFSSTSSIVFLANCNSSTVHVSTKIERVYLDGNVLHVYLLSETKPSANKVIVRTFFDLIQIYINKDVCVRFHFTADTNFYRLFKISYAETENIYYFTLIKEN